MDIVLVFVSGGTLLLHDFDQTNLQTLMAAAPDFAPPLVLIIIMYIRLPPPLAVCSYYKHLC